MAFQARQSTQNDDSWQTADDVTMPQYSKPEMLEDQHNDYSHASTEWSFLCQMQDLNLQDQGSVNTFQGQTQPPVINIDVEDQASRGSKKKRKRSRHPRRCSAGGDSSMAPSQSKQSKTEVVGHKVLPEATEEEWKERAKKRKECLANTRGQHFYKSTVARLELKGRRPRSPDPEDRSLSKRDWENKASDWRNIYRCEALKAHVHANFPLLFAEHEDLVEAACRDAMSSIHGDKNTAGYLEKLENETKAAYQERLHKKRQDCALATVQATARLAQA